MTLDPDFHKVPTMNALVNYFTSVLGIKSIVGGRPRNKKSSLFVSVLRSQRPSLTLENQASQLFNKMLAAIGLERSKVEIIEVNEISEVDAKAWGEQFNRVVILDTPGAAIAPNQGSLLWTYHPQELLLNSSLKKIAWEQLKKLTVSLLLIFSFWIFSSPSVSLAACTGEITINGAIGPATVDFLDSALNKTKENKCSSLLILINTPGGSLQSTHIIVETILNSPVPILCLVHPSGGRAGSAGAIILQACHVSGGINPTNIGAATPILMGGEEMPKDLRNKMVNDTVSWVEGLAKLRKRNLGFARDIVEKASSLGATEAAKIGGIDFVVNVKEEFLEKSQGREVLLKENAKVKVEVGRVFEIKPGLRHIILDFVSDPQFAYFIFMGSIALLYFEITHPGFIAPGVIGAIGLVVSLISFHKLNVWWGGVALLFLGIIMLVLEAFVPSFGALGIGGIVAFTVGSLFLFDPIKSGYSLPLSAVLPTTFLLSAVLIGLGYLVMQTRNVKKRGEFEDIIGAEGVVVSIDPNDLNEGYIEVAGENWKFRCETSLKVHQRVKILSHKELVLKVKGL